MSALRLTFLLIALSCSCKRYVFQEQGVGEVVATKKEVTIDVPAESDILFVLDNSGSMGEEIDNMRCSITGFVQALSETGNKFRVAVTTTDNQDQATGDCNNPSVSASVDPKRHGRCGHFLAPAGKPGFLKREDYAEGSAGAAAMAADFAKYLQRDTSTIDTGGSAVEQPLKSALAALDPALSVAGGPNEGFFRQDSLLLVVIVTDESDCSFAPDKAGVFGSKGQPSGTIFGFACYAQKDQLTPPSQIAADIVKAKGRDKSYVRVGLISASVKDQNGTLHPAACKTSEVDGQSVATDECACFFANATAQPSSYCNFTKNKVPMLTSMQNGAPICGQPAGTTTITNACPASPPANPGESNCCTALANERLFTFADQFVNLKATICQRDFSRTLLDLANLADRQCFSLEQTPIDNDPNNIQLKIRRKDAKAFEVIPLIEGLDGGDGWYYENTGTPTACLAGAFKRKNGDTLSLLVVSSQTGEIGITGDPEPSR